MKTSGNSFIEKLAQQLAPAVAKELSGSVPTSQALSDQESQSGQRWMPTAHAPDINTGSTSRKNRGGNRSRRQQFDVISTFNDYESAQQAQQLLQQGGGRSTTIRKIS